MKKEEEQLQNNRDLNRMTYQYIKYLNSCITKNIKLYFETLLLNTSIDNPYKCDIVFEPYGTFGLSDAYKPHIIEMWKDENGTLLYIEEGIESPAELLTVDLEGLISIISEIEEH